MHLFLENIQKNIATDYMRHQSNKPIDMLLTLSSIDLNTSPMPDWHSGLVC